MDGLKESLKTAQADAQALPGLQKELETAQADLEAAKKDGWKDKHDALKKEFEDYKKDVTAKETKAAKEAAAETSEAIEVEVVETTDPHSETQEEQPAK